MTETITATEVLKSRQNFSYYIEHNADTVIKNLLKDYPTRQLQIIYPQLTQSSDGLIEIVSRLEGNQKAYIFWFIVNEKEDLKNIALKLNLFFDKNYCGIFIIKAVLNEDKIEFEPVLKPALPSKQVRNENTPAKLLQKAYWEKYFEICDELQSEMQVNPAPQHYQYIPIGKKGVQIMQTVNTKDKYIATELFINNDKDIFKKLMERKTEIEEKLGFLDWQALEGKKSSRIRQTLNYDISDASQFDNAIKDHIKMAEDFRETFKKYL
ncbi:MAG TPA: DUF4268 domain-containing protein [Candidatus Stercorousia faecigallinarum]|nr:DUF4268 domain-containing protein [Candidatus Stercorousia faecigallinarum]